jgi:hypothetical protein
MTEPVPILKDEHRQQPVPSAWRPVLRDIAGAIRDGNYRLRGIAHVQPLDEDTAAVIARNVREYGETLSTLPEACWDTSVCQWQLSYWELLVDLFTLESGQSDLVLHVNVFEDGPGFVIRVHLVYVP